MGWPSQSLAHAQASYPCSGAHHSLGGCMAIGSCLPYQGHAVPLLRFTFHFAVGNRSDPGCTPQVHKTRAVAGLYADNYVKEPIWITCKAIH